jgi:hypothetical protein
MSSGEFGFGEVNEFQPAYGGVDWRARFEAQEASEQRELHRPVWFEAVDELGDLCEQLTQENTSFYLNRTDPEFDALAVVDPRDGNAIWWTRGKLGNDAFNELFAAISDEVLVVETKYPLSSVAEYVLGLMCSEMDRLEPEDFERGNAA